MDLSRPLICLTDLSLADFYNAETQRHRGWRRELRLKEPTEIKEATKVKRFFRWTHLRHLYCYAKEPPIADYLDFGAVDGFKDGFSYMLEDIPGPIMCTIHVPKESVDLYKNAKGWKGHTIVPIEDEITEIAEILEKENKSEYIVFNGKLLVNGKRGDKILLYDTNGICIKETELSEEESFCHYGKGLHILKINNESFKIMM